MSNYITYVAMDTHKKQHKIAVLSTESGEFIEMVIANTAREIGRMVNKMRLIALWATMQSSAVSINRVSFS